MLPPLATDSALYAYLEERICTAFAGRKFAPKDNQDIGPLVDFVYNFLLDWMGPGRDPTFLEFSLLADGYLPFKIEVAMNGNEGAFEKSNDVLASWKDVSIPQRHMATGPEVRGLSTRHLDKEKEVFATIGITMDDDFRDVLLGELADPWPVLPEMGPLHYRPARWVEPRPSR